jgi:hypothetical protein
MLPPKSWAGSFSSMTWLAMSEYGQTSGRRFPSYRKTAGMLAMLVGDGVGERATLLQRLLDRLGVMAKATTFDAAVGGAHDAGAGQRCLETSGLHRCSGRRSGRGGASHRSVPTFTSRTPSRIPVDVPSDEQRQKVSRQYGTPFRDACELLLALMAVDPMDPVVAPLRTGSPSAHGFAKLVRQLDARLASLGATPHWRVRLHVEVPPALHRMSPSSSC